MTEVTIEHNETKPLPGAGGAPISYAKAVCQEAKLRKKIARAHDTNDKRKVYAFTDQYLKSYSARLVATVEANRGLKRHRRVPKLRLPEIAAKLNVWKPCGEEVAAYAKEKQSNPGGYRIVQDFGIESRARQELVRRVLEPQVQLHPKQFGIKGSGTHDACYAVLEALEDGNLWTGQLDTKDCYPSINGEKMTDLLPLPPEVTRYVLTCEHLNILPRGLLRVLLPIGPTGTPVEVRSGIPQGSICSPIVASVLLAPVASELSEDAPGFFYADNMLVAGQNEGEVIDMLKTLESALMSHPAGPLRPTFGGIRSACDGFDFLGFRFTIKKGKARVKPSERNMHKFQNEFANGIATLTHGPPSGEQRARRIKNLRRYVHSWTKAFDPWHWSSRFRKKMLAEIPKF